MMMKNPTSLQMREIQENSVLFVDINVVTEKLYLNIVKRPTPLQGITTGSQNA